MKKIIDKTEKIVVENVVDAKKLKEKLNQRTDDVITKSEKLMKIAERKTSHGSIL